MSRDRPQPPAEAPAPGSVPPTRSRRIGTLAGESLIYGLGGILARVAGIFLVPIYLTAAGTAAFGTAELVVSAVTVAAIVLKLGIVNSMSRFTIAESATGDWAPVVHTIYTFVLAASTASAIVAYLARGQIAAALDVSETVATIGILGLWVQMNYDVVARLYRIQRRAKALVAFQLANVAITIALTLVLVLVLDQGAAGLLLGNFAGTGAVLLVMLWSRRGTLGFRRADTAVGRELLRFSVPLMPTNIAIWVINLADRIQMQRLAGPVELGQYAAGARVAAGMTVLLGAFQAAWTPFAHALRGAEGDEVAKQTYVDVMTIWSMVMGWGLAALTLLSAPYIALSFPESAQEAIPVVPLLATGVVLYGAYLIVSIGITIAKRTRTTPFIAAIGAVANVGLNFWFIPHLGLVGAGITTVIGFGLLASLQALNARRVYPVPYEWGRVARVAAYTAGIVALSVWAIPETGAAGIALRLALIAAYPLGLVAIGAASLDDLRRVPSLWRMRRRPPTEEAPDPLGP